jgi:hypothetical protein
MKEGSKLKFIVKRGDQKGSKKTMRRSKSASNSNSPSKMKIEKENIYSILMKQEVK